jgi:hypothetical protein
MAPSADDVEQDLLRLRILNFTVQILLRSYEDATKDYKSASLRSMLDMVRFLLDESENRFEVLDRQLSLSPLPAETGRPMKAAEVAELLSVFRRLPNHKKALLISKARELEADCAFRRHPASDSDLIRPGIPI